MKFNYRRLITNADKLIKGSTAMKYYMIALITSLMMGCSSDEQTVTPVQEKLPEDHILKDQVQQLDKAKEVDQLLQDAAAKQRETIEEQSQ